MAKKLFGTSGIRGKVKTEVTAELALNVGKSLAYYLGNKGTVILGYDTRTTNQMLDQAICAGLLEGGVNVVKIGMVPTPLVGYACEKLDADAGVMLTASHNPSQYNGIKLWNKNGMAYTSAQESEIEEIYNNKSYISVEWDEVGRLSFNNEIKGQYIDDLVNLVDIKPGLKVVIDCASGAGSEISPLVFRKAGCEVTTLNSQPDGFFPGRDPEPIEENLSELISTVKELNADIGLAHDGDADRTICIDEKGNFVLGDKTFSLVEKQMLKENNGGIIVTTVATSQAIYDIAEEYNGEVIATAVGDLLVARALKDNNGLFGGEENGGLIFPNFVYGRDAAMTVAKILEIIAKEKKGLSELVSELPIYYSKKMKIECSDDLKEEVMDKIANEIKTTTDFQIDTTDGVKILKDDGWVIIRPSGTEPIFRCFAESDSQEKADEMTEWGIGLVEKFKG